MDKTSEELISLFNQIAKKGWIKGNSQNWGEIGLTFEREINKLPDNTYKPDFIDIEIKCCSRFSRYPLNLFTIAFDGPNDNEIMRITEKYGQYDKDFNDSKVLFKPLNKQSNGTTFKFDIDMFNKKIFLCIYDNNKLIEKEAYINFSTLKKHIDTKLTKLAIIKASTKKSDKANYFRYYSIFLYKIKDFDTFLKLIESNLLEITIISRISKSGNDAGRYRNKNIVFAIKKYNIQKLFDCYYQYDCDRNY